MSTTSANHIRTLSMSHIVAQNIIARYRDSFTAFVCFLNCLYTDGRFWKQKKCTHKNHWINTGIALRKSIQGMSRNRLVSKAVFFTHIMFGTWCAAHFGVDSVLSSHCTDEQVHTHIDNCSHTHRHTHTLLRSTFCMYRCTDKQTSTQTGGTAKQDTVHQY